MTLILFYMSISLRQGVLQALRFWRSGHNWYRQGRNHPSLQSRTPWSPLTSPRSWVRLVSVLEGSAFLWSDSRVPDRKKDRIIDSDLQTPQSFEKKWCIFKLGDKERIKSGHYGMNLKNETPLLFCVICFIERNSETKTIIMKDSKMHMQTTHVGNTSAWQLF